MKSTKYIKHSFKHSNPILKALASFIVIFSLAYFVPKLNFPDNTTAVLGSAAIFYSILIGFYISTAMANLTRLKTLTASETGALIAIYHTFSIVEADKKDLVKEKIDKYLIKRFQYEINDYVEPTTKEFYAIFDCFQEVKAKSNGEEALLNSVSQSIYYIAQARKEITIAGAKIMNLSSWLLLGILSVIIIVSLFLSRDGSIANLFIVTILSTAAILALVILYDIDGNMFGEEIYAIDNYQDVFTAIGSMHYYPEHVLIAGRFKPKVKEYRTGDPDKIIIYKKNK